MKYLMKATALTMNELMNTPHPGTEISIEIAQG